MPERASAARTLVVTNEFPTGPGGTATFTRTVVGLLPPDEIVVYAASTPHDSAYDAPLGFPVLRDPARTLLPTAKVTAGVVDAFRAYGCDRVLFGTAAPMGLLAPALRSAGARGQVALTQWSDLWWARLPVARQVLRRIGDAVDALTYMTHSARSTIARALSPSAADRLVRLAPAVDTTLFRPGNGGAQVRRRYGIGPSDPVIVSVAPLTRSGGQNELIRSMPRVLADIPNAQLLLVGGGSAGRRLADLARELDVADQVILTGAVPPADTPAYLDAGTVFARLDKLRLGPRWPDEFDSAVLQAQSSGLPVLLADRRGASDRIRVGETALLLVGPDRLTIGDRLVALLGDPGRVARMGKAGRAWIQRDWSLDQARTRLAALLAGE